jgi:tRNA U34 5-methylaminomethyl-2-thiouridine-forming methyltransferase MnmC
VQESEHIFINYGFDFCKADPVRIFEVGFGTGLNALLTAVRCINGNREVFYTSIEKYPLGNHLVEKLNYPNFVGEDGTRLFSLINSATWGEMQNICRSFSIIKLRGDLAAYEITGKFDLIFFDAFGPDKQPEMWSAEIFDKIAAVTVSGGVLVTYSSKGQVKSNLKASGFEVTRLPGPPGKRHIIRAIKI